MLRKRWVVGLGVALSACASLEGPIAPTSASTWSSADRTRRTTCTLTVLEVCSPLGNGSPCQVDSTRWARVLYSNKEDCGGGQPPTWSITPSMPDADAWSWHRDPSMGYFRGIGGSYVVRACSSNGACAETTIELP